MILLHGVTLFWCAVRVEGRSPVSPETYAIFLHHPHVFDIIRHAEFLATALTDLPEKPCFGPVYKKDGSQSIDFKRGLLVAKRCLPRPLR